MQHGSPVTALRIVAADLAEPRFDEAAGLMLYDGGDFTAAAARLKRLDAARPGNPAVGLQIADIYAAAGNGDQAETWILHAIPLAPALSWTPYADLAFFALSRGDLQTASRRLDDGLAFFPASRELRLMKARVAAQAGDVRSAEALLSGLLADRPADSEAALLLLTLQGPEMSPEAARARLWKLFDLVPGAPAVYDALASSLIAARDWDGLTIALRQFQASGGQPDARLLAFQGFASAMRGDDAGAIADFRRSAFLARDGSARFDIALVMLRQGGARAALSELDSAEAEVMARTPQEERPGMLSRIETLRGAARLLDGDIPGAGSALTHALALDPRNLRAGLLLRKLEAGGQ
jgi:predicted Zn-dependent protease